MMRDQFNELERARSALWSLDAGCDRDTWVRIGMGAKAAGLDFDDFHNWSAGAGNYKNESECRSVWNSIKDGGVTAASLFRLALTEGWTDSAEPRPERTQSRQSERKPQQASKPLPYNPETLWSDCKPASASNWYVDRKKGLPDGLRVYSGPLTIAGQACDGALVLPCFTLSGELASLQFVTDNGKPFLPGVKLHADGCLIVGGPIADKPVYWWKASARHGARIKRQAARLWCALVGGGLRRLPKPCGPNTQAPAWLWCPTAARNSRPNLSPGMYGENGWKCPMEARETMT